MMLRPAALIGALVGALICALILAIALTTRARADDAPALRPVAALHDVRPARPARARLHTPMRRAYPTSLARRGGVSLAGIAPALAAKARELEASCGAVVISARRHTRVARSGRMSLHASGRAIDVRGNYGCIYARLRGWPGGYSTDAGAVRHVHVSIGGREDGLRFAHHHSTRARFAARRHHRWG